MPNEALIVVDVQHDFCPGGSLAVPEGDAVVPVLNEYIRHALQRQWPVLASRDWHPEQTKHFHAYGGTWPPHCVQGTKGAEFHSDLRLPREVVVVTKGADPEQDAYSAFDGVTPAGTPLAVELRRLGVRHLYVGGLATDYCVKWTVEAAVQEGFQVTVLLDASRGVNLKPHDAEEAIEAMARLGAGFTTIERVFSVAPRAAR